MLIRETIPPGDRAIMERFYEALPQKSLKEGPEQFVNNIAWRIFIEVCCAADAKYRREGYRSYDGAAYRQWVADEVHYALEATPAVDHAKYEAMRQRVVQAIVNRAVHLFSEWEGHIGSSTDNRNLRASLKPDLPNTAV